MANQSPEKTFRIGRVSASVFKNMIEAKDGSSVGQKRFVRSVNVQRSYQDDDGKWSTRRASSWPISLPPFGLLQLAQQYVESLEADTTP